MFPGSSAVTFFVMTGVFLTQAILGQVLAIREAIAFGMETWQWFHPWRCHLWIVAMVNNGKCPGGRSMGGLVEDTCMEGAGWNTAPLVGT